jgi:hypothetical protein
MANYAEHVIAKGKEQFAMGTIQKVFSAPTIKSFREFVFRDITCEISENHQSYVFKKRFLQEDPATQTMAFSKDKQPYHSFPSCTQLHSASTVNRTSFKIKGALQLIFETRRYKDDADTYSKVYIANTKEGSIPPEVISYVRSKIPV